MLFEITSTLNETNCTNWENGLNDQIKTSVRNALDARELIKVTLLQNTDEDIHEVAEILEDEIGCDTVLKSDVSSFFTKNHLKTKPQNLTKSKDLTKSLFLRQCS